MSQSIFASLSIDRSKKPNAYLERDVNDYFQKVDTVIPAIKILAKGILYRLEYDEQEGLTIEIDNYKILMDYIGWLVWKGKKEKAKEMIHGLILLSHGRFSDFESEIDLVHPIATALLNKYSYN